MRITSGQHKGRNLTSPVGLGTRPTSDRARQAVFNLLLHARWRPFDDLDGLCVMDVFAGTGALGLEALSRGAAHAVFVENDRAALACLRQNIAVCGAEANSLVMASPAQQLAPRPATVAPRQLIFFDPPYNTADKKSDLGRHSLQRLVDGDWLAPDALCVMEMAKKFPEDTPQGFSALDERDYGVALLRFLTPAS